MLLYAGSNTNEIPSFLQRLTTFLSHSILIMRVEEGKKGVQVCYRWVATSGIVICETRWKKKWKIVLNLLFNKNLSLQAHAHTHIYVCIQSEAVATRRRRRRRWQRQFYTIYSRRGRSLDAGCCCSLPLMFTVKKKCKEKQWIVIYIHTQVVKIIVVCMQIM